MRAARRSSGFTLIELLVALFIFGVIGQSLVAFFSTSSKLSSMAEIQLETHQALSATMDTLAREIRLAGGCLPTNGTFMSIAATNNGSGLTAQDAITVRQGRTDAQRSCTDAQLTAPVTAGDGSLALDDATGFEVDIPGYITDGAGGDFFKITRVSGNTIDITPNVSRAYGSGAGGAAVYAMRERVYRLCPPSCPDGHPGPALVLDDDRKGPHIFAEGISGLDIRYQDINSVTVDVPADDAAWRLVTNVLLQVRAQSIATLPGGGRHIEDASLTVKPRNLQP